MADFAIKQGDTAPSYQPTLTDARSTTWDLVGSAVKFNMRRLSDGELIIDHRACTVVDPVARVVRVDWSTGDTEAAGLYLAEFEVTLANGRPETFPDNGHLLILVTAQADEMAWTEHACTVDDVALYVPDLTADEAVFALQLAIPRVEAEAEAYLQHALVQKERTESEVLVYPGQSEIPLHFTPVRSVLAVAIDGTAVPSDSWVMLRTGVVVGLPGYFTGAAFGGLSPSSASVTYVGGIGVPELDTLKPALLSRVARIVTKYRDLALGTDQVSAESYNVQYLSEGFTMDEMQVLAPYRSMSADNRWTGSDGDLRRPYASTTRWGT